MPAPPQALGTLTRVSPPEARFSPNPRSVVACWSTGALLMIVALFTAHLSATAEAAIPTGPEPGARFQSGVGRVVFSWTRQPRELFTQVELSRSPDPQPRPWPQRRHVWGGFPGHAN